MSTIQESDNSLVLKKTFYVIYILAFLTAFHFALSIYVESSFIEGVLEQLAIEDIGKLVGTIFAVAAFITFMIFVNISKILRFTGNFLLAFFLMAVEILSLIGLSLHETLSVPVVVGIFIVHLAVGSIIIFNLDLFLESVSDDESTGSIRGTYLTAYNSAIIVAPFIAGLILTNGDFWKVFLAAAFIMLPALVLIYIRFRDYEDPAYDDVPFFSTMKQIIKNKNIFNIMMCSFFLRFFFSWMVIYVPIYLHQEMGISFSEILSIVMPIALLPFILFEFALGKVADSTLGEKELLTIGLIIMAIGTVAIAFFSSSNPVLWGLILFISRTGGSFVEIMTETYFYKKIDATDTHLIGYYKNLRPLAYIIAPILGTGVLLITNYEYLFVVLGAIMLYGTVHSLSIQDTK
jgi:MFS family permease